MKTKKLYFYFAVVFLSLFWSSATAQLVVYEPADYYLGATDARADNYLGFMWNGNNPSGLPANNTNFVAPLTGNSTGLRNSIGADIKVVAGLTYSNAGGTLATHANAFQQTTAGWQTSTFSVYRKMSASAAVINTLDPYAAYRNGDNFGWNTTAAAPYSLYYSFLLKVSDLTGPSKQFMLKGSGDFIFQQESTTNKWQFRTQLTPFSDLGDAVPDQTVLMVCKFTFTDAGHTTIDTWFNPTLGAALPTPTLTATIATGVTFNGFQFKDGNNKLIADEIRMGLTEADVMPLVNVSLPVAPTALAATAITKGAFNLEWTASVTPGVTYEVYKNGYSIGTSATTSFAVTTEGGFFNYSVKAVLGADKSEYSVGLSQSLDPIAPTALTLTAGTTASDGYNVTWTASVTPGVSYEIFRDWVSVGTVAAGVTTFTVTGCPTPNLNYYIVVKSVLGGVKSSPSNIGNYKTGPGAPGALVASAVEKTAATLTWAASATGGVSYDVFQDGVKIGSTAAGILTYNVTGLTASTLYSFTVKSVLNGLSSSASVAIPVTTLLNVGLGELTTKGSEMIIFNNPATGGVLQLSLKGFSSAKGISVTIFHMNGKKVYVNNLYETNNIRLNTSGLKSGVYVIKAASADTVVTKKFIVQ